MKIFVLSIMTLAAFTLTAGTVKFRSGEILSAEIGTARPAIRNWNKHLFEHLNPSAYAAVAVKVDPKRKISIYDYALELNGVKHTCVAVRTDNGGFEFNQNALSGDKNKIYTLLFFITNVSANSNMTAYFVSVLPPDTHKSATVKLTYRGSSQLCPFNSIKKDGNF